MVAEVVWTATTIIHIPHHLAWPQLPVLWANLFEKVVRKLSSFPFLVWLPRLGDCKQFVSLFPFLVNFSPWVVAYFLNNSISVSQCTLWRTKLVLFLRTLQKMRRYEHKYFRYIYVHASKVGALSKCVCVHTNIYVNAWKQYKKWGTRKYYSSKSSIMLLCTWFHLSAYIHTHADIIGFQSCVPTTNWNQERRFLWSGVCSLKLNKTSLKREWQSAAAEQNLVLGNPYYPLRQTDTLFGFGWWLVWAYINKIFKSARPVRSKSWMSVGDAVLDNIVA